MSSGFVWFAILVCFCKPALVVDSLFFDSSLSLLLHRGNRANMPSFFGSDDEEKESVKSSKEDEEDENSAESSKENLTSSKKKAPAADESNLCRRSTRARKTPRQL